jgi:hypothetical protein
MGQRPATTEQHVDRDGVTRIQKPRAGSGTWIVGLALGFTVLCVIASLWLLRPSPTPAVVEAPPERLPETLAVSSPPPPRPRAGASRPAASPAPMPAETPGAEAPQDTGVPAGEAEGIHLYRPGTKPLKQGLVVPEGFPLPPGYVRHYQTTDNGEGLKPILMFHEDYKPLDANGQPLELPSNRVVPPELAPTGMPIEVLELPEGPEGVEPIP